MLDENIKDGLTFDDVRTVLTTQELSNAGGLLKEDLDSLGGSGFSFGDHLLTRWKMGICA